MIVINVADPLADRVNTLEDANIFFPGEVDAIRGAPAACCASAAPTRPRRRARADAPTRLDVWFDAGLTCRAEWFTWYKATDPETGERDPSKKNVFGFNGDALDTTKAWQVIREAHGTWADLVTRQVKCGMRKLA